MSRDLHSGRKLLLSTCTIGTIALATACGVEQAPEEPVAGRHELPNWQNAAQSGEYHCGKFYLVHMDPAPESKTATPLSTITLKFSRAVDPSTTGGVVLRERESKRIVPANVTSNGVFVHITPLRPLNHNYRYTVDVDQIEAQSPHTDPLDVTKRFFTAPNFPDLYIRYKNGLAVREHDFMWTPSTGELRVDHFVPGPDGILQTTDDVQDTWVLSQYDTEQDNVYTIVRGEPGPDGIYETADDAVVYERTLSFDARGETSRSHLYFGPDMQMGTGDDYTTPLQSRYYDNDDVYLGRCDGNICTQYVYYAGETHVLTYDDPGPDGVWRTADDVLSNTWVRQFVNSVGIRLGSEEHVLASDGTPTPSDATLQSYTDHTLVNGLATELRTYSGPGADGVWRTTDDVASRITNVVYDADGFRVTAFDHDAGPDGVFGSADDLKLADWFY